MDEINKILYTDSRGGGGEAGGGIGIVGCGKGGKEWRRLEVLCNVYRIGSRGEGGGVYVEAGGRGNGEVVG